MAAVKVRTLEVVVGFGPIEAVIPAGSPETDRVTLPENPFKSVTVMVSGALVPCFTGRVEGEGASVKVGAGEDRVMTNG